MTDTYTPALLLWVHALYVCRKHESDNAITAHALPCKSQEMQSLECVINCCYALWQLTVRSALSTRLISAYVCRCTLLLILILKLVLRPLFASAMASNTSCFRVSRNESRSASWHAGVCKNTWHDDVRLACCMQGDFNPFCCARAGATTIDGKTYNGGMDLCEISAPFGMGSCHKCIMLFCTNSHVDIDVA